MVTAGATVVSTGVTMVTAGVTRDSEVANCSLYCSSCLTEIFVLVVHFTALLKSNIIGLICEICTFISPRME